MEKASFDIKHTEKPKQLQLYPKAIKNSTKKIAIKCPAPNWQKAAGWGDYHFALALQKSLVKLGYIVRLDILPDWYSTDAQEDHIVFVLRGRQEYKTSPQHINLMWNICHPDEVSLVEYEKYHHVFIPSEYFSEVLNQKVNTTITPLLQCSDPDVFYKPSNNLLETYNDLLFVGNSRGQLRKSVKDCLSQKLSFTLYGRDWHGIIPSENITGAFIPNNDLHSYYTNAAIVLNDHWPDMAKLGYISNRIFDIALANGFIISDNFRGKEIFGDNIITYDTAEELKELYEYWIMRPEERREKSKKLREYVFNNHTFDIRAQKIDEVIQSFVSASNSN